MLCACWPVGINSYLKAARISMSKSIQVACECWERNSSLKAISFTNQVVFSLGPEKDAYGVRAILPRPEEAVAKGTNRTIQLYKCLNCQGEKSRRVRLCTLLRQPLKDGACRAFWSRSTWAVSSSNSGRRTAPPPSLFPSLFITVGRT